jgi:hypothetical protein
MPVSSNGSETTTCAPEVQTEWISAAAVASKCSIPERIAPVQVVAEVTARALAIGQAAIGLKRQIAARVTGAPANRRAPAIGVQASRRAPPIEAAVPAEQAGAGATALSRCSRAGLQISSPRAAGRVSQVREFPADRFPPVADSAVDVAAAEAEAFEAVAAAPDGVPISR